MKLSYIIPVYKVEKYLRQCIDSVLAQTMDDYEIILVDDGSPDSCPEICDEYKMKYPSIIKVIHKENGGLANARNVGMKSATGKYIFFVDSDDYLVNDGINTLYNEAEKANADVLQTSYVSFNENNNETSTTKSPFNTGKVLTHKEIENEICCASSKMMITYVWRNLYNREFLLENDIFYHDELKMVEDAPFDIEVFTRANRFIAVDIPIYCYRIRDDSLQRQKYTIDYDLILDYQWKLKLQIYEKYCEPRQEFYKDIGQYTVKAILPVLLGNIYKNKVKDCYAILKRIGNGDMLKKSFEDYDINEFKSKSLDWTMTNFIKKKMYFPAHLICKYVLYK